MLMPRTIFPAVPTPHELVKKVANTTSIVIVEVEDMAGDPVVGAWVQLTVNGIRIGKHDTKTIEDPKDKTAKVTFSFPTASVHPDRSGLLSFSITVTKGRLHALESGLIPGNKLRHFLLVAEPKGKTIGSSTEQRRRNRSQYPLKERSQKELLDDLVHAAGKVEKFLTATDVVIHFKNEAQKQALMKVIRPIDRLSAEAAHSKVLNELDVFVEGSHKLTTASKIITPVSLGITVITGLYDVVDAIEKDDDAVLLGAFGNTAFGIVAVFNPYGAVFYLAFHIGWGLAKLAALNPSEVSQNVGDAVARQTNLPSLNNVGDCPAFAGNSQYRLKKEGHRWVCQRYQFKEPCIAGLAFDERDMADGRRVKGGLIFVLSTGDRLLLPVRRMSEAELDRIYKDVQANAAAL